MGDKDTTGEFALIRCSSLFPAISQNTAPATCPVALPLAGWWVLVGCQYQSGHIAAYCGRVGGRWLQAADSAGSGVPTGIDRVAMGRRDGSSPGNYGNNDIAWAGIGVGCPTVPQIRQLIEHNAPLDILKGRLRHFWPILGASTEPDIVGGLDLAVTGATWAEGDGSWKMRRGRRMAPPVARPLRALQARVSVGDAWRPPARVPVLAGVRHVGLVTLDQAGNEVSVEIDGTTSVAEAASGTHNAQTGALVVGAGLVDGVAQTAAEAVAVGVVSAWDSVLAGADVTEARGRAAAWMTPEPIGDLERKVAVAGSTVLTFTGVADDPSGWGLAIEAATLSGIAGTAVVTGAAAVTVTPSGAAIGATGRLELTWKTLAPAAVAQQARQLVDLEVIAGGYANGYAARRRCIIPADRVSGSGSLTNFVARFDHTLPFLRSEANGGELVLTNGSVDVRFETEAGVKLEHDIAFHDPATGRLVADIRFPTLSGSAANRFWLYTGKDLETAEASTAALQDYLAVIAAATGEDRTGNGRDFTVSGIESAELLGPGGALDGADVATLDDVAWLNGLSALTVRVISRRGAAGTGRGEIIQGTTKSGTSGILLTDVATGFRGQQPNVVLWVLNLSSGTIRLESSANAHELATEVKHATWASADLPELFVDGVKDTPSWVGKVVSGTATANSALTGTIATVTAPLRHGSSDATLSVGGWTDRLGEIWYRAEKLGADHVATEAAMLRDPAVFIGVGGRETPDSATAAPVAAPIRTTATAGTNKDVDVLAQAYDPDGTLSISSVGTPGHGTASIVGGQVRYKATASYVGEDRVSFTITDGTVTATSVIVFDVAAGSSQPIAGDDALPLNGLYEGCAQWCINLTNIKLGTSTRFAYGRVVPRTGKLKAVICEVAANQSGTESKSGGTGLQVLNYWIRKGKSPVSGDAANVPSRPGDTVASGKLCHGKTAVDLTGWTQDTTDTELWTKTITLPGEAAWSLNLQEGTTLLARKASKAAAKADAGSFWPEAVSGGTKIWLRPSSGNPNTNGKVYRTPAESRRLHRFDFEPYDVTKGDFAFVQLQNADSSPATNFISLNGPSMKTSGPNNTDITSYAPWGGTPPRRLSPHAGDHAQMILQERATADTWQRRAEFMPCLTLVYDLGDGQELKIGDAYRQGEGELRNTAKVGGTNRVRIRWRRKRGNLTVRNVWVVAHWLVANGIPTDDLDIDLVEEAGSWGAGWTDSASIVASSNTAGGDPSATTVKAWAYDSGASYAGWSKGALGADRTLTEGRIYRLEFSSGTTAAKPYFLHPILDGRTLGAFDDDAQADLNLWMEDPATADAMAFAQYSTDGGTTWKGFKMNWDAATVQRRDIAIAALLEKA